MAISSIRTTVSMPNGPTRPVSVIRDDGVKVEWTSLKEMLEELHQRLGSLRKSGDLHMFIAIHAAMMAGTLVDGSTSLVAIDSTSLNSTVSA